MVQCPVVRVYDSLLVEGSVVKCPVVKVYDSLLVDSCWCEKKYITDFKFASKRGQPGVVVVLSVSYEFVLHQRLLLFPFA